MGQVSSNENNDDYRCNKIIRGCNNNCHQDCIKNDIPVVFDECCCTETDRERIKVYCPCPKTLSTKRNILNPTTRRLTIENEVLIEIAGAVRDGNLSKVAQLFGPDLRGGDKLIDPSSGKTLIYHATVQGDVGILKYLSQYADEVPGFWTKENPTLLHAAAHTGQHGIVVLLLDEMLAEDRTFNTPQCLNECNETPDAVCKNKEILSIFQSFAKMQQAVNYSNAALIEATSDAGASSYSRGPMMYYKDFCLRTCRVPYIGNKYNCILNSFEDFDVATLTKAILDAEKEWLTPESAQMKWYQIRNLALTDDSNEQGQYLWKSYPPGSEITKSLIQSYSKPMNMDFMRNLVYQISRCSFLSKVIDLILEVTPIDDTPGRSDTPALLSVACVLCAAIAECARNRPCSGTIFSPQKLDESMREELQFILGGTNDVISWDRLLFGYQNPEIAIQRIISEDATIFFIIAPPDDSNPVNRAADISIFSAYHHEALALFCFGQHFIRKKAYEGSIRSLASKIGCHISIESKDTIYDKKILIVEIQACDLFWELSTDLYESSNDGSLWTRTMDMMMKKWRFDLTCMTEEKLVERIHKAAEVSSTKHATTLYRFALQQLKGPEEKKIIECYLSALSAKKHKIPSLGSLQIKDVNGKVKIPKVSTGFVNSIVNSISTNS